MIATPVVEVSAPKKNYRRRLLPDRSQLARRCSVQLGFFLLNLWVGVQFYLFVRHYEVAGTPAYSRPPGVEGWLPIAGLMNTKYFLLTGRCPACTPRRCSCC